VLNSSVNLEYVLVHAKASRSRASAKRPFLLRALGLKLPAGACKALIHGAGAEALEQAGGTVEAGQGRRDGKRQRKVDAEDWGCGGTEGLGHAMDLVVGAVLERRSGV
jgi:hypothetical protein